jgi:hypothetical protein
MFDETYLKQEREKLRQILEQQWFNYMEIKK